MDIANILAMKIAELTLIVFIGYAFVKSGLLKTEDSRPLSLVGLYIIAPAVMIHAFQIDYTPQILQGLMLSFGLAVFFHCVLILSGVLLKKLFKLDPLEHAASIYSNSGNLIIPIVYSLFGKEWIVYATCFSLVQNFLFWTHCKGIIQGKVDFSPRYILKNINILSIIFGVVLFAFQIKLPEVIDNGLNSLGIMIGPNAMLVAGMLIASMPLKQILGDKRVYLVSFIRLILIPLVILLLIKISGATGWVENGETLVLISFLATCSPAAATVTQMALIYGKDAKKSSAIYGVTTLLCVLTMPLIIALYQWL